MSDILRERLLRMGPDPDTWPRWPVLPVKKPTQPHFTLGYCVDQLDCPGPIEVYEGDCWAPAVEDKVIATYPDWQAMADDGWTVD